jgi:cytidylate kinase
MAAARAADGVTPEILGDPRLRGEEIGQVASIVSALPPVRTALLQFQRDFASRPPGGAPGAVLDGRDIGTVVCPDAAVKIFVTASAEARAQRRVKELRDRGVPAIYERVLQDMKDRDARDSQRRTAPLTAAADAFVLDTTDLDAEAAFRAALDYVTDRLGLRLAREPR